MFQPAISRPVAGLPKPKCSGAATPAMGSSQRSATLQDLNIADFAGRVHAPGLDRVVVIDRARATHRAKLADSRLHVAGFVDGTRLQERGPAVPRPVEAKTRERLRQHRLLQLCVAPVAPPVRGDVDPTDPAASRP